MKSRLLGNLKRGLVFVISAPAGTGKTTIAHMLVNEFPCVVESVSFTTRRPRAAEVQGIHYNFLSEEEFEAKIAGNEFLEYVRLYGSYYGTSRKWVEEQQMKGKHVLLVIDTQGALQLKGKYPAQYIFIKPPSIEALRNRMKQRGTESPSVIEERLAWASKEIEAAKYYDYCIINDDLDIAYQALRSILIAEEHKTSHIEEP